MTCQVDICQLTFHGKQIYCKNYNLFVIVTKYAIVTKNMHLHNKLCLMFTNY
jgi:hypothetical protein